MPGSGTLTVPLGWALAVIIVAAIAVVWDLRTRRIPNALTGSVFLAALVAHGIVGGGSGAAMAALGAVVAGGLLLPGWLMGWMGAGDVKTMAAVGACLAWPASLVAVLASMIAGGVISLIVAARHRAVGRALTGALRLGGWAFGGVGGGPPATTGVRFPFATAILAGSVISLWVRM